MKYLSEFVELRDRTRAALHYNMQHLNHLKEIKADPELIRAQTRTINQISKEYGILRAGVRIMIKLYKEGFENNFSVLYPVMNDVPKEDFDRYLKK